MWSACWEKGQNSQGADQDDTAIIPYTTMQKRLLRRNALHSIAVTAVSAGKVAEAEEQIIALLRQRHGIGSDGRDDFSVRNLSEIAKTAAGSTQVMTVLLGIVASISLWSAASAS